MKLFSQLFPKRYFVTQYEDIPPVAYNRRQARGGYLFSIPPELQIPYEFGREMRKIIGKAAATTPPPSNPNQGDPHQT